MLKTTVSPEEIENLRGVIGEIVTILLELPGEGHNWKQELVEAAEEAGIEIYQ